MSEAKITYGANMLITTSIYNELPTVKLIPATADCPYTEAFVDRSVGWLVIISKIEKEMVTMLPRLDDNGELVASKKPKRNGKQYQEQRAIIHTFQEFYIMDQKEIESFIKAFAINLKGFDYKPFITRIVPEAPSPIVKPENVILDANSEPITKK